jgi:hypothetical protein
MVTETRAKTQRKRKKLPFETGRKEGLARLNGQKDAQKDAHVFEECGGVPLSHFSHREQAGCFGSPMSQFFRVKRFS